MGAELLRAEGRTDGRTDRQTDGQTGMTKLIVAFLNVANAPKKEATLCHNISSVRFYVFRDSHAQGSEGPIMVMLCKYFRNFISDLLKTCQFYKVFHC